MTEFTKDEIATILNIFASLKFTPGQGKAMTIAEGIIKKCKLRLEQSNTIIKDKKPIEQKGE